MPSVFSLVGSAAFLEVIRTAVPVNVRLFKSDTEPTIDTIFTDIEEADFPGYPVGGIPIVAWEAPNVISPHAQIVSERVTFSVGLGGLVNVIYGWFLSRTGLDEVIVATRFSDPHLMVNFGDRIQFAVQLTARSEYQG